MKNFVPQEAEPRAYHHGDLRRALVEAALTIVTEKQDWGFSLREVARRAGVSHNAPYNHFTDKNDLLAAVAAVGLEILRDRMSVAVAGIGDPTSEFLASGRAYVRAGIENPALYRLIFGPDLSAAGERPAAIVEAGARTREVLEGIIERGAREGVFAIAPDDPHDRALAALTAWSVVHGVTTLVIDRLADPAISIDALIDRVTGTTLEGLRRR